MIRLFTRGTISHPFPGNKFVILPKLPLNANGKIDRKLLPAPELERPELEQGYVGPRTPTEETLAGIWQQVLGLTRVGVHDNFFELGGDSILSIQIVARAHQAGLKLSPKLLFRHQTIAALAAAVAALSSELAPVVRAEQGLLSGPLPLTPIQHYFFEQALAAPHHFNQSLLLVVRRRLAPALLQRAVAALLEQHDALRLRFRESGGGWEQFYGGAEAVGEVVVEEEDVSGRSETAQRAAIAAASDRAQRSLRLGAGGLLRVVLFETGGEQRLLLVAHHLVVDGVSWRVLLEDLARVIGQLERGVSAELGAKTSSYRQWAERLAEYGQEVAAESEYWRGLGAREIQRIPVDFPAGLNTIESTQTVSASLDAEETRALLQEVPEAYRTQINDVLLTGVVEAFGKWSGQRQMLIDMEGHGREELWEDIDLSRTVGWFTTLFPVAFQISPTTQVGALLKSVKDQLRRVPNRGIGYSLLRYLSNDAEISDALRAPPQAEVRFNYLGQLDNVLPSDSLFSWSKDPVGAERDGKQLRAYLLDVTSAVSEGRLQLNIIYSENVHRRSTVEILTRGLLEALRAIISHCQSPESSDLSPSDFPFAKLSQQQLDRIMSKTTGGQ